MKIGPVNLPDPVLPPVDPPAAPSVSVPTPPADPFPSSFSDAASTVVNLGAQLARTGLDTARGSIQTAAGAVQSVAGAGATAGVSVARYILGSNVVAGQHATERLNGQARKLDGAISGALDELKKLHDQERPPDAGPVKAQVERAAGALTDLRKAIIKG